MKWRSLKDTFKKEIEKGKKFERSGAAGNFKSKYRHYDLLTFLIPCFEGRSTEDSFQQPIVLDDDTVDETQTSNFSSGETGDMSYITFDETSVSQPSTVRRSMSTSSAQDLSTSFKKSKVTSAKKNQSVEKEFDESGSFRGLIDYLKDNKEKQLQYMEREENDYYIIVKSAIPHLKKIDPDLLPEFHADLINLCRKYVTKTQTRKQGNRYGQMHQEFYRPPAQSLRPSQSNTNAVGLGGNTQTMYHTLQPLQRSEYTQPEPSFTQALFDMEDNIE